MFIGVFFYLKLQKKGSGVNALEFLTCTWKIIGHLRY